MNDVAEKADFKYLLEHLKATRGFDFSAYKTASLMRRVQKRMLTVNIESYADYVDFLEVHPDEFTHLFNTILINVTAFFRDKASWDYLNSDVIPAIVAGKQRNESIRIWSAGCASGEEAYSLAILFAEHLGIEQFRERVKIYATDADDDALNQARQASYTPGQLENVPEELRNRYFEELNGRFIFHKELRRFVIYGRHDLIQDAPISRLDLLVCRNTLMYLNAEIQTRILMRFHFALNDYAYLFLGKAETFLAHNGSFGADNLKLRMFRKVQKGMARDRMLQLVQSGRVMSTTPSIEHEKIRKAAGDAGPVAQVVVDINGLLVHVNQRARTLFSLSQRDLGRPFHDLELSYRPVELRSCMETVYSEHREIMLKDVHWPAGENLASRLDVLIAPLSEEGQLLGVSIFFQDVTHFKHMQHELERFSQELETATEELQSTNEELETTNEELQSTNEELETTNEELQSTNEELETMNEELQSTNEELHTVNEEVYQRNQEFNHLNSFMESVLASLRNGVVVVDKDLKVLSWNIRAEDLWGLRSDEVKNKNFLNLDIGLPVSDLKQGLWSCLSGESEAEEQVLEALNRRGKRIQVRVICTPLMNLKKEIYGAIIVMEEWGSSA